MLIFLFQQQVYGRSCFTSNVGCFYSSCGCGCLSLYIVVIREFVEVVGMFVEDVCGRFGGRCYVFVCHLHVARVKG